MQCTVLYLVFRDGNERQRGFGANCGPKACFCVAWRVLVVEKLDGVGGKVGGSFWTRLNAVCGEVGCPLWRG